MRAPDGTARYSTAETVDFVIVGSGAAGGVLAKELSTRGHSVVVLEQGPRRSVSDFRHDEKSTNLDGFLLSKTPVMWRQRATEEATRAEGRVWMASLVGGSSVHFTANFWRFRPVDFNERSRLGPIAGTGFADWPITYEELEPYYTKVDWEVGVSGAPGPDDAPRSRPYPTPPLTVKSSGILLERAAMKLGLKPFPAPMAILSQPHNGRPACQHCGFCMGFGCEYNAKSSSLASVIPVAEATGRCEIRPLSHVHTVETDAAGRATGVVYFDAKGVEQRQRARAVVLAANGVETPRLLLSSASARFPDGLANSSGMVGKHLMFNGGAITTGEYEHQLNEHKSAEVTRIVHDFYESDPKRGFYGGGGIDARGGGWLPIAGSMNVPGGMRGWGADYKDWLAHAYTRTMMIYGHTTSLAVESNNVTLDPAVKDRYGRAAARITYEDHADDLATMRFFHARTRELHEAAGAKRIWGDPPGISGASAHFLGTARMGNDPRTSVIDRDHRTHDVRNLFICDGSSMVTSGRGQPTMTIMALAFRAGERISDAARRNEI
ncbi:MAG: GMC family oxidoreductase [Gemmatimonadetes bacterium]|nr:GMC family oxidoreductase [Gemmatimonadota bacterium]